MAVGDAELRSQGVEDILIAVVDGYKNSWNASPRLPEHHGSDLHRSHCPIYAAIRNFEKVRSAVRDCVEARNQLVVMFAGRF